MKFISIFLIVIQGFLMAATITKIDINSVQVPIIVEEDHNLPVISMQIVFKASGSISDKDKAGIAKLSAMLLNEGTTKDGAVGFAHKEELKAITINADAGKETFVFEISSLKEHFKSAVELFLELIKDPNLTDKTLKKVKTQTLSYIKRKESDFDYIASKNLNSILFKNTPLGQPQKGTVESVKSISLKEIKSFIKENIVLNRAIVAIGGDLTKDEAIAISKEILINIPNGTNLDIPRIDVVNNRKDKIVKKDTEQAYIYFGSEYFKDSNLDDEYKARVSSFILGSSGFGSRLMEEIRVKKGLAYSAYGRIHNSLSSSYFSGYLQTKLETQEEAQKIVKEVVSTFVQNGVTQKELDDAKKFLKGSEPLRVETMSQRVSRSFNEYYNNKEQGWTVKQLELIDKLNLKDLNEYISSHKEITNLTFSILTK